MRHTNSLVMMACVAGAALGDRPVEWAVKEQIADTTHGVQPMVTDSLGNSYIVATSLAEDIVLAKFSPTGVRLWTRTWNGPAGGQDLGVGVAVTPDGSAVYAMGRAAHLQNRSSDYAVIKYDANGTKLWEAFYNGPGSSIDDPKAIALHPAGGVVVTGGVWNGDERLDFGTVRFDADGNRLWSATFADNGRFLFNDDTGRVVRVNDAGDVFISGVTSPGTNTSDIVTISYDGQTGAQRWFARYDGTSNDTVRVMRLSQDAVYVSGRVAGLDGAFGTIKYNQATGEEEWTSIVDPGFDDFVLDMALGDNGDAFVVGVSDPDGDDSNFNDDAVTIALDASTGFLLWSDRFGDTAIGEFDRAAGVVVDPSGRVLVTGDSRTVTDTPFAGDAILLEYDADTGARLDLTTLDTTENLGDVSESLTNIERLPNGDFISFGFTFIEFIEEKFLLARFDGGGGCPADLDGDGDADADDFFSYLDLFAMDDPGSDIDGDGDTDADDFFAYLDLFAAGC